MSVNSLLEEEGVAGPLGQSYRDIILPQIWSINDFPPKNEKGCLWWTPPSFLDSRRRPD